MKQQGGDGCGVGQGDERDTTRSPNSPFSSLLSVCRLHVLFCPHPSRRRRRHHPPHIALFPMTQLVEHVVRGDERHVAGLGAVCGSLVPARRDLMVVGWLVDVVVVCGRVFCVEWCVLWSVLSACDHVRRARVQHKLIHSRDGWPLPRTKKNSAPSRAPRAAARASRPRPPAAARAAPRTAASRPAWRRRAPRAARRRAAAGGTHGVGSPS